MLSYPSYKFEQWHATLIMMAISAFSVSFNVLWARHLPLIEGIILIVHICAWIGILVTLWVLAPIGDPSVFTQFNDAGWHSSGVTALVGVTAAISPLLGSDAAAHMSEELKDAGKTLPQSMIWATIINGAQTCKSSTAAWFLVECINMLRTSVCVPRLQYVWHDGIKAQLILSIQGL